MYIAKLGQIFKNISEAQFFDYAKIWIEIGATYDEIHIQYSRIFVGKTDYDINKVKEFWDKTIREIEEKKLKEIREKKREEIQNQTNNSTIQTLN